MSTMNKFNPGMPYQVVAFPIARLDNRNFRRAIKRFAKFFNVDNDVEHVIACAEWWGYTLGNSSRYIFIVEDYSEYSKIAYTSPELWDLALDTESEPETVLIIK